MKCISDVSAIISSKSKLSCKVQNVEALFWYLGLEYSVQLMKTLYSQIELKGGSMNVHQMYHSSNLIPVQLVPVCVIGATRVHTSCLSRQLIMVTVQWILSWKNLEGKAIATLSISPIRKQVPSSKHTKMNQSEIIKPFVKTFQMTIAVECRISQVCNF